MSTSFETTSTPNPQTGPSTSQLLSSPNLISNAEQQPTVETQSFPAPQTFTFLPQLYSLISRLAPLHSQPQPQSQSQPHSNSNSNSGTLPNTTRASRSPTLTRRPAGPNASSSTSDPASADMVLTLTQTRSRDETIEIKDLPALVYPLRQQIARAKDVVQELPDVGRTVAQQEVEIRELEGRVGALRERLALLGGLAAGTRGEGGEGVDVVMKGVEG